MRGVRQAHPIFGACAAAAAAILAIVACGTPYQAEPGKARDAGTQQEPDAAPFRPVPTVPTSDGGSPLDAARYAQALCAVDQRCFPAYFKHAFTDTAECVAQRTVIASLRFNA